MIHLNAVEAFYEPRKEVYERLNTIEWEEPLMREDESAFICGLLRAERPRRILEVGVYCGATTSIIAQCMADIGTEGCEIHSIDVLTECDTDADKKIGYVYENTREYFEKAHIRQTFHTGNIAPAFMDEIGDGIDFAVLDTVHFLPGELLDFLSILPYLKKGAVVCLHDISQHHTHPLRGDEFACGTLFSAVTAEKYLNARVTDSRYDTKMPNIGAFRVTEQTMEHIENVFLAICLKWHRFPSAKQLLTFRESFCRHYSEELIRIFDNAVDMNCDSTVIVRLDDIPDGSRVIIYGYGLMGRTCYRRLKRAGRCEILAWVDPDFEKIGDSRVTDPDAVDISTADVVMIGVSNYSEFKSIREKLAHDKGIDEKKFFIFDAPYEDL
ncbi:MAG: class I SAM-dependent methyltransferase [Ruminiclostridium sp.]|nr:class I SAM-dependent methyltransferase [Ruminiclostridium sp.]